MTARVGILGLGVYLPSEIRRNDWWPADVVATWMAARRPPPDLEVRSDGQRRVLAALREQALDPFQGTVERRILSSEMSVLDMEQRAAAAALADAGVDASAIDLLVADTISPDVLLGNPACQLHARLGLAKACLSLHTSVATYAFLAQLAIAEAMIAAGRARFALLVQSGAPSRLLDPMDAIAPFFGDCATAVVVGPVAGDRGMLGTVHFTDGRFPRTLVAGVPGQTWYADGRATIYVADPAQTQQVFLNTADDCKQAIGAVLDKTGTTAQDVAFLCIHQGTPWLRRVVQEFTGLEAARSVETFARTGYVFGSTLPVGLHVAVQDAALRPGELVLLVGGGPGTTFGATLIRWGRA